MPVSRKAEEQSGVQQAAKAMSKLGASKGGKARAASLSPEERREIAKHAAESRWGTTESAPAPKETHQGLIKIAPIELQCGVLENGIRVFSTRGITRSLGGKRTGTTGVSRNGVPQLPPFLESKSIKPHISSQLMARLTTPLQYKPQHGGRTAYGYEATLLPELCGLIIDANAAKPLPANQKRLVGLANLLIRGFASVGIIALIDEATGYQEERAKDELSKILEAYVEEALRPYVSKFPSEFFREVYRLHKWEYKPGVTHSPRYLGKFINKYVYKPLPPGVLERLQELNPTNQKGQRKHKHFQYLTESIGDPHLDKQVAVVTSLLKLSDEVRDFDYNFQKVFAKHYQPRLPLVIDAKSGDVQRQSASYT